MLFMIKLAIVFCLLLGLFYHLAKKRKRMFLAVSELYSPGYGLLLSKRSKKIDSTEFPMVFRNLLIEKSHLVEDIRIRLEIKDWLRNNRDPEGYRLQMLFESQLDKYYLVSPSTFTRIWRKLL